MFSKKPLAAYRRPDLYLNQVPGKGRGVFCRSAIVAGETLEVAPIMIFSAADTALLDQTILADYCFNATILPADIAARAGLADASKAYCLVMGLASYCNHRTVANASRDLANEYHTVFYLLNARTDIPADTEICLDYGAGWFTHKKLKIKAKDGPAAPLDKT